MTSWRLQGADTCELKIVAFEPCLHRLAGEIGGDRFEDAEHARYRYELRIELLAEDARAGVTACARERPAAQRSIYMYAPVSHHLGSGAHLSGNDEIAVAGVDALTRANGLVMDQCG